MVELCYTGVKNRELVFTLHAAAKHSVKVFCKYLCLSAGLRLQINKKTKYKENEAVLIYVIANGLL